MVLSSGEAAITTATDAPVTAIANGAQDDFIQVTAVNEGTVRGWVSVDNGNTWLYMPAAADATHPASRTIELSQPYPVIVKFKRIAGGTNLSGLYADCC